MFDRYQEYGHGKFSDNFPKLGTPSESDRYEKVKGGYNLLFMKPKYTPVGGIKATYDYYGPKRDDYAFEVDSKTLKEKLEV